MKEIRDIAEKNLNIDPQILCKCGGAHEVCLNCNKCRVGMQNQLAFKESNLNELIDHTLLKANASTSDIKHICDEANLYKFKSVCINPCFINYVKFNIDSSLVCAVIGFPLGANSSETKFFEVRKAIEAGAQEIDMVINVGLLKENFHQYVFEEITHISNICISNNITLKVIIETCLLTDEEIIIACLLAKKAGADFVKTSTGFSTKGAQIEQVKLMREVVGPKMGVKASGGIKTHQDAIDMIEAGANRLGTSNSINIVKG